MSRADKIYSKIDYSLLFFIIGVTYVKLYIKVAAILFFAAYLLYKKYKPARLTSLHRFYLLMPVTGTIGSLIHGSFSQQGYWFGWSFGIMYWILGAATAYMLYIAVLNTHIEILHKTLKAFFALNFIASIVELLYLIKLSGHPVPYWYWDASEYFGSSTGDHIYGIFGNVSVTNAMISTLGAFYFLYRRDLKWAVMCIITMLLCTSNLTIALFLALSVCVFILVGQKKVRLNILALLLTTLVIYPILSPQNVRYVDTVYVHETTQGPTQIVIADKLKIKSWVAESDKNELEQAFSKLNASITSKINYYRLPLNDNKVYNHIDELKYIDLF
ncbi:MAG: hypothetical protein KDC07_10225, partial [Chitinophagaceae bacterium]|nr:hypothetical protein [Chitinophagaceae bacterium]